MTAAAQIKAARARAGMTQSELARRSGIRQPSISAFEHGASAPRPETLERLLAAAKLRPSAVLHRHRAEVIDAANRHGLTTVRLFGSAARGGDTTDSDIDLLVRLHDGASLVDIAAFAGEVEAILGYPVDVVTDDALRGPVGARIAAEAVPL